MAQVIQRALTHHHAEERRAAILMVMKHRICAGNEIDSTGLVPCSDMEAICERRLKLIENAGSASRHI